MKRLTALLILVSTSAFAQTAPKPSAPAPNPDKKICRRVGPPTGSILAAKTVCWTAAEWAKINGVTEDHAHTFLERNAEMRGMRLVEN